MEIHRKPAGDLLQLEIHGVLDNESSTHFRSEIEACVRDGWHRIVVDLSGVDYLSSAGIGALLACKKQLNHLEGLFGVYNAVPAVKDILERVQLFDLITCDPQSARMLQAAGTRTVELSSSTRFYSGDGIDLEIYQLADHEKLSCRWMGAPEACLSTANRVATRFTRDVQFTEIGFGIGSLSSTKSSETSPVGEILSVAGAATQSSPASGSLPDYSLTTGDFKPSIDWIQGIICEGPLTTLIRFEASTHGDRICLSNLVRNAMQQTELDAAAFAILADCSGLIGAQIRRLPESPADGDTDHFQVVNVREWLSFTPERVFRRNLALIVGIAIQDAAYQDSPLQHFVRPLERERMTFGHFHAAVFPYRPLKKRTLQLDSSVAELFESGTVEDVMHLLRDDRPITGAGESELLSGACWIGEIGNVRIAEQTK